MWSSEPYKVDSGGGQATSGSTIMEGDNKFDHTGVSNERIPFHFTVTKIQSFRFFISVWLFCSWKRFRIWMNWSPMGTTLIRKQANPEKR